MAVTQQNANVSAAGPGAGAVLAALALVPGNEYAVSAYAYYSGTEGAGDADNIGLYVDGVLLSALLIPPLTQGTGFEPQPTRFNVLTTTGVVQLKTIAAGSGTQVCHTALVAEDVSTAVTAI